MGRTSTTRRAAGPCALKRDEEFPGLAGDNLYADGHRVTSDGNCLFNAFSVCVYGDQTHHKEIREDVVFYLRENAEHFKHFIPVPSAGGGRRNPKRKNVKVASLHPETPSESDIDRAFEKYLADMSQTATWADHNPIQAFADAYGLVVQLYRKESESKTNRQLITPNINGRDDIKRPMVHIAYHEWNHYSCIRNLAGPHEGFPKVQTLESPEEEARISAAATKARHAAPWKIRMVQGRLPYQCDLECVKLALQERKGNVEAAIRELYDQEDHASVASQTGSVSTQRDTDDDEEELGGTRKKSRSSDDEDLSQAKDKKRPIKPLRGTIKLTLNKTKQSGSQSPVVPAASDSSSVSLDVSPLALLENAETAPKPSTPRTPVTPSREKFTDNAPSPAVDLAVRSTKAVGKSTMLDPVQNDQASSHDPSGEDSGSEYAPNVKYPSTTRAKLSRGSSKDRKEVAPKKLKRLSSGRDRKANRNAAETAARKDCKRSEAQASDASSKTRDDKVAPAASHGKQPGKSKQTVHV